MAHTLTIEHNGQTYSRTTERTYTHVSICENGEDIKVVWHMSEKAARREPKLRTIKLNAKGEKVYRKQRGCLRPVYIYVGTKTIVEVA